MQSVENQIVMIGLREFEKCFPYAKIVPRKNFRNSGKCPFIIANSPERVSEYPGEGSGGPFLAGSV